MPLLNSWRFIGLRTLISTTYNTTRRLGQAVIEEADVGHSFEFGANRASRHSLDHFLALIGRRLSQTKEYKEKSDLGAGTDNALDEARVSSKIDQRQPEKEAAVAMDRGSIPRVTSCFNHEPKSTFNVKLGFNRTTNLALTLLLTS
ncbi:hypothetical protein RF11_04630 [Thelohanellus kitauei]|uniref:Uncharacterized protein n=1 Tax=Thelohanellus kitauei TaxID=669202 RepID=A0A0C2J965_THEKT|nr:hypothetical protein RF11_04630 [Thelohanellus kitauei]